MIDQPNHLIEMVGGYLSLWYGDLAYLTALTSKLYITYQGLGKDFNSAFGYLDIADIPLVNLLIQLRSQLLRSFWDSLGQLVLPVKRFSPLFD